jgi:23S rRNA (adenine2503-C2)-methyltransferase
VRLVGSHGDPGLAMVHIAEDDRGRRFEFVDSVQPPRPRSEKWVVIVSTMLGCPVGCRMCDAGGRPEGRLSADQMLWQVGTAVSSRFPSGRAETRMLKVQFARMGEPALNPEVLDALDRLPGQHPETQVFASVSTVAPVGVGMFLERLRQVKDRRYPDGRFQLQFSVHSTDPEKRAWLCPARTLSFEEMATAGAAFRSPGDKRVTLNFCLIEGVPLDPAAVREVFDPEHFLVKLTPLNPTGRAHANGLRSVIGPGTEDRAAPVVEAFREQGFDTILSIGEYEENQIGSNCGMYLGAADRA